MVITASIHMPDWHSSTKAWVDVNGTEASFVPMTGNQGVSVINLLDPGGSQFSSPDDLSALTRITRLHCIINLDIFQNKAFFDPFLHLCWTPMSSL